MPTISIIVPAYNCENTIRKCVDSIINQSSNNWELVIVNDGSTDNTKKICETYVDSRKIFLINQHNSGVSAARNIGIEYSTGEYIVFVDSDDCLLPNALTVINETIKEADICYYNYQKVNSKNTYHIDYIKNALRINIKDFDNIFCDLFELGYVNPPWAKCYKRALIKEKFRDYISIGEDLLFNLYYLKQCSSISLIPHEIYSYQESGVNSLSNNKKDKMNQLQKVYIESVRICNELFDDDKNYNCITKKYIVDQLIEIEKKIRYSPQYKFETMKSEIELSSISSLSRENNICILNNKWRRAVNMVKKESYLPLFLYLNFYKVLGGIKHGVRKD